MRHMGLTEYGPRPEESAAIYTPHSYQYPLMGKKALKYMPMNLRETQSYDSP